MGVKIKLDNVRLSFEHIFKPHKFEDNQEPKYSATLIIPKDHPQLPEVKRAMFEAGKQEFPSEFSKPGVWPKGYSCSLKDADVATDSNGVLLAEKNLAYEGCYVLDANSSRRPIAFDRRKAAVTEDDGIIYSGCYVNVGLNASGYAFGKVKKGVKCYLNVVQFVADGERFGVDASADFEALDDGDDDFM